MVGTRTALSRRRRSALVVLVGSAVALSLGACGLGQTDEEARTELIDGVADIQARSERG